MTERRLKVSTQTLFSICQTLTARGRITGITAEGELLYVLESEEGDDFALGYLAAEVERELSCYDTGVLVEALPPVRQPYHKTWQPLTGEWEKLGHRTTPGELDPEDGA